MTSGATGLLSTLLYVGIGLSYLPGGWLADRYGSRRVLFVASAPGRGRWMPPAGAPRPGLDRVVPVRDRAGRRGSHRRRLAGSTPGDVCSLRPGSLWRSDAGRRRARAVCDPHACWVSSAGAAAFAVWGALGLGASLLCLLTLERRAPRHPATAAPRRIAAAFRSRPLWTIGLVHLGTLGLGQAIAPWLAVYFALSYGLPLDLSAMLGAVGLLAGMLFRPLGGLLLSHAGSSRHSALMRAGTALACVGVRPARASPARSARDRVGAGPLCLWDNAALCCRLRRGGSHRRGERSGTWHGAGRGLRPLGPCLGLRAAPDRRAVGAAREFRLAVRRAGTGGSGCAHRRTDCRSPRHPQQGQRPICCGCGSGMAMPTWRRPSRAAHVSRSTLPRLPAIVTLGAFAQGRGSAIIRRLQHAGGLPLLLPPSPAPTAGEAGDLLADEAFFRETFDRCIWPLFCQLLVGQTRGLCLIEGSQRVKDTNGRRATDPLDLVPRATSDAWSAMMQRYLALLAWLVGMPVLGASWELHSLELNSRRMSKRGPAPERIWPLPAKYEAGSGDAQEPSVYAQFVAAVRRTLRPHQKISRRSATISSAGCAGVTGRFSASCTSSRWHADRKRRGCLRSSHQPWPGSRESRRRPRRQNRSRE